MPIIAMTREMGSLGKDVAAAVSVRLGKPVVHHEMIDQLANKMRLRKSHVIRFLDGKANIWERLTTDQTSLSIYTADETLALAESDNVAVIRGWGSAHLLRPIQHVICVRVCAPMKVRVERMMERLNTDNEDFVANEIRLSEEAHGAITRPIARKSARSTCSWSSRRTTSGATRMKARSAAADLILYFRPFQAAPKTTETCLK